MAMSAQEKFDYWLDIAQYDLQTAEAMLTSGRWLYVAFMCQQAVEKLVKGLFVLYLDDDVPRVHNIRTVIKQYEKKLPVEIPAETIKLCKTPAGLAFDFRLIWKPNLMKLCSGVNEWFIYSDHSSGGSWASRSCRVMFGSFVLAA